MCQSTVSYFCAIVASISFVRELRSILNHLFGLHISIPSPMVGHNTLPDHWWQCIVALLFIFPSTISALTQQ